MLYFFCVLLLWATPSTAQDLDPCTTKDKPWARFFFNDSPEVKLTCAQFVAEDHCLCTMDAVKTACCASCAPHKNKLKACECQDLLIPDNPVQVIQEEDNVTIATLTNCAALTSGYGHFCDRYRGKGNLCCQSCKWQSSKCFDDQSKFKRGTDVLKCPEFIAYDHCHCAKAVNKKSCCPQCLFIDTSNCNCDDTLSPKDPVRIQDPETNKLIEKVSSCDVIIQKYPQACLDAKVSGKFGSCCTSCKAIDASCQDLVNNKLPINLKKGQKIAARIDSCEQLKSDYPELCRRYGGEGKGCCKTCETVDTSCLNTRLTTWMVDKRRYKCANYVKLDPCHCDEVGDKCCQSCKRLIARAKPLAHCCKDDPDFRTNFAKCKNCTCGKLLATQRRKFVRNLCNKNRYEVADHCCNTCRKAGVYVPAP